LVYLTILTNCLGYAAMNNRMFVNNKLQKDVEVHVAYFKVLPWHFYGGTEENYEN
jgi:hypothetical protein